jgi:CRISPR-associated protein Csm5
MNRFIDVVPLALTPLTPIHIGCGIDFEPTNYIIDNGVLYHFEPTLLPLKQSDRDLLVKAVGRTGDDAIRALQKFFYERRQLCRQASRLDVPVAARVAERYRDRIGQVAQRESGGRTVSNQLEIERTAHHPYTGKSYLPGSSLKGSLRTGWLNRLDTGPEIRWNPQRGPDRRAAVEAEADLLHGTFSSDPFRLVDVADASSPQIRTRVVFAVDRRKKQRPDRAAQSRPKDLSVCCEVIGGGQFRGLHGELRFVRPHEAQRSGDIPAPQRRIGDFSTLARACNRFYLARFDADLEVLYHLSPGAWTNDFRKLIDSLRPLLDQGNVMLARVGRHSGAESVTLERRRCVKIKVGQREYQWARDPTTIWLAADSDGEAAEVQPFGWVLVEQADAPAPESLQRWCGEESQRSFVAAPPSGTGEPKPNVQIGDEVVWQKARLKFNKGNGTLTAIGPGNAQAHAHAPRGEEILSGLPQQLQQKVRTNQFVQLAVRVRGSELVGIEP